MTALLGLIALAGYQNRDKIADWMNGRGTISPQGAGQAYPQGWLDSVLGNLGGGGVGGLLGNGLRELLDRFRQNGHGDVAQSWIDRGPNEEIAPADLRKALGSETLDALAKQTGLSRDELLEGLRQNLPELIDKLTPNGRLPTEEEASRLM